eukprot:791-Eustigmatos_ZCMA.PRE.1
MEWLLPNVLSHHLRDCPATFAWMSPDVRSGKQGWAVSEDPSAYHPTSHSRRWQSTDLWGHIVEATM